MQWEWIRKNMRYVMRWNNDKEIIQINNHVGDNKHELTVPLLLFLVILFGNKFENKYEIINSS